MCNNKNEHFTFKKTWQSFHGSALYREGKFFFHLLAHEKMIKTSPKTCVAVLVFVSLKMMEHVRSQKWKVCPRQEKEAFNCLS